MQKQKFVLITGSCGLIGSESVHFFISKGFIAVGIDNNMREFFLGKEGSTQTVKNLLIKKYPGAYIHLSEDIRNKTAVEKVFREYHFDLIIHAAAQPSHDWAASQPLIDFSVNAGGTVLLLEKYRKYCPDAVFIFTSTDKVYGNTPNSLPFIEYEKRYDLPETHPYFNGVDESMSIDKSLHSLYGVSKLSADVMVQEYGRYFNLNTGVFRCGCMTGSAHAATMHHGFLTYLVKCIRNRKKYRIFGYSGKQVRDNIHASDVVNAFYAYYRKPKRGEVYNLGGSRAASVSILEAIEKIEKITGKRAVYEVLETPRRGDHKWYISDNRKFMTHFPEWKISHTINSILEEIYSHTIYDSKNIS